MNCGHLGNVTVLNIALVCTVLVAPIELEAQRPPDFLFRNPLMSLSLRYGYAIPRASGEVFTATRQQFTLESSDFNAPVLYGQIGLRLTEHVDIAGDMAWTVSRANSNYRDWVDQDDNEIEQSSEFGRRSVTMGAKIYLLDRYKNFGRFVWLPKRLAPFIGVGVGWVTYRFEQEGDFIDFETLDVFSDRYRSSSTVATVNIYAGTDWSLSKRLFLTGECRYSSGSAELEDDFTGFGRIDLSGFMMNAGLSLRY